jgi:hypothetical protein
MVLHALYSRRLRHTKTHTRTHEQEHERETRLSRQAQPIVMMC